MYKASYSIFSSRNLLWLWLLESFWPIRSYQSVTLINSCFIRTLHVLLFLKWIYFDGRNRKFMIFLWLSSFWSHLQDRRWREYATLCYNWAEFWFTDQRYQHDDFNKLKEMLKPYKKALYILQRHWNPDSSVLDIPRSNQCAERSIEVMEELYYMCKNKDKLQLRFILSNKY